MSTPHRETVSHVAARSLGRSWRSVRPSTWAARAASVLALACLALACQSTENAAEAKQRSASADAAANASALELTNVDPVFQPALESLHAAVRAGDDETASAILAHV